MVYLGHSVHKGVESPERYVLQIWWTSIEAHNDGFRQSPAFAQWRGIRVAGLEDHLHDGSPWKVGACMIDAKLLLKKQTIG